MNFINNYFGLGHVLVSALLIFLLVLINKHKNSIDFETLILPICIFDLITYYYYVISFEPENLISLLPFHLCFLTEIMIFLKILFNFQINLNFIFLNSVVGSIAGLVNNNLTSDMHYIFFLHHYLAHFVLAVFAIVNLDKVILEYRDLKLSVFKTSLLLAFAFIFNTIFGTNYWFTSEKPYGNNLSLLFPDRPWYLVILILLGLLIYLITFLSLKLNRKKQNYYVHI